MAVFLLLSPVSSVRVLLQEEGRPQLEMQRAIAAATDFAQIQSVELRDNGTELLLQADRPIAYRTGWDWQTAAYRITIYAAELPENVRLPRPSSSSPILWVRQREDDPETVTLLVQVGARAEIEGMAQPNPEQLSLKLASDRSVANSSNNSRPTVSPPHRTSAEPNNRVPNNRGQKAIAARATCGDPPVNYPALWYPVHKHGIPLAEARRNYCADAIKVLPEEEGPSRIESSLIGSSWVGSPIQLASFRSYQRAKAFAESVGGMVALPYAWGGGDLRSFLYSSFVPDKVKTSMPEGTRIFWGDGMSLAYKRQGNRVVVTQPRQSSNSCSCFVAYIQPDRVMAIVPPEELDWSPDPLYYEMSLSEFLRDRTTPSQSNHTLDNCAEMTASY